MTNVAVEMIDRGLLKVLTLSRRSTHRPESGVLNGASRTHPADGWASGCRRVRTTRSVGRWRERLEESEAEGLMDERSFGHRGGGWMPNQSLQATPVGARRVVLSRRPGVPELGRSAQCIIVMKILSIAILFGAACMVAPVTKADSLEFARKSLGLEIGTDLFGAPLSKFEGAEKVGPAQRPNGGAVDWSGVDWYQTKYSAVFGRAHPGRVLRYGFKDGRLVAVHVTVSGLEVSGLGPDKERAARIRESISTMFANFKRLGGQGLVYQDKSLRVLFTPFCNPTENFFAVILLTPPEKD